MMTPEQTAGVQAFFRADRYSQLPQHAATQAGVLRAQIQAQLDQLHVPDLSTLLIRIQDNPDAANGMGALMADIAGLARLLESGGIRNDWAKAAVSHEYPVYDKDILCGVLSNGDLVLRDKDSFVEINVANGKTGEYKAMSAWPARDLLGVTPDDRAVLSGFKHDPPLAGPFVITVDPYVGPASQRPQFLFRQHLEPDKAIYTYHPYTNQVSSVARTPTSLGRTVMTLYEGVPEEYRSISLNEQYTAVLGITPTGLLVLGDNIRVDYVNRGGDVVYRGDMQIAYVNEAVMLADGTLLYIREGHDIVHWNPKEDMTTVLEGAEPVITALQHPKDPDLVAYIHLGVAGHYAIHIARLADGRIINRIDVGAAKHYPKFFADANERLVVQADNRIMVIEETV